MKILIDCYQLIKGKGKSIGIYNYTKYLLDELIPILNKKHDVIVLNNSHNINDFSYEGIENIIIDDGSLGAIKKVQWELIKLPWYIKKNNIDLYFSPRGFLPYKICKYKAITTIHDLIPVFYREFYKDDINKIENLYIVSRLKKSAKRSDKIITISNFSKDEIKNKFNIDDGKIEVIYNGLNNGMEVSKIDKEEDFIFSISSSELKHKNLEGILKSYDVYYSLSKNPLKLKICGVKKPDKYNEMISKEAWSNIQFLPFLTDEDINWYYKNANVFLFLSKIEGFGFPPLEALKFSTPVICSNIPCFREILDKGVNLINEDDYKEVAEQLIKYEDINEIIIDLNMKKYNWKTNAEKVSNEFEDLLNKRG